MYRTLKDAYEVTNDPRFLSGKTQIWYYKRSESRDFGMGSFGLERSGKWPFVENLSLTHVFIGFVDESNPSKVFQMMQGEYWSPNGEASTLPELRMAGHTSMSVGDIIVFPGSKALMVDMAGFYDLADAPVSPRMASMRTLTASDRSALIKLASSLPEGSPERRAILASLDKTAKVERFVGEIDGYLYAVQIEGVNPRFAQAAFGRQLDDLRLIEAWKNGAKKDWVSTKPRKGQKPLPELKKWLASVGPREFYAKWDLRVDDDTRVIYFK